MMRAHFVGIGGVGMSGIAKILLKMGHQVSGSDLVRNDKIVGLEELGARITIGHNAANLGDAEIVVASTAIPKDNIELVSAHQRGIPVISRAQMLGRLMANHRGIAVSGTHGKTTTTSMISMILTTAGLNPTVAIGGEVGDLGSNAVYGSGDIMVAEADESDGSFLELPCHTALVTNIDSEHMDYYKDLDHILASFHRFLEQLPDDGAAVVCTDCPNVKKLVERTSKPVITYGLTGEPDISAKMVHLMGLGSTFDVFLGREYYGTFELSVPGKYNVVNALAAIATARRYGVPKERIFEALRNFHGAKRRFEILGMKDDVLVVDDYAHHPTEIRSVLTAAKELDRRVVAVFQPHRYSRTKFFLTDFASAFADADVVVLTDIYPAFEAPIPGISGQLLATETAKYHNHVIYAGHHQGVVGALREVGQPGDLVIVMGAGDIRKVGEQFLLDDAASVQAAASGR